MSKPAVPWLTYAVLFLVFLINVVRHTFDAMDLVLLAGVAVSVHAMRLISLRPASARRDYGLVLVGSIGLGIGLVFVTKGSIATTAFAFWLGGTVIAAIGIHLYRRIDAAAPKP